MKTNRRCFAAALSGLLVASCAQAPDTRVADLTRDYLAGRINYRHYHDLCYVVYAERHMDYPPARTTTSDTSSASDTTGNDDTNDKKKNEKCKDEKHPGQPCPHPPAPH